MKRSSFASQFLLCLVGVCLTSCAPGRSDSPNAESTPRKLIIRGIDSPANPESREPNLFATADNRIILSWIEQVDGKRYRLRFAERTTTSWSETRTVAEGENWFINWADFPSVIALTDGSFAAHWLVKNGKGTYAYDVQIARSEANGTSWANPIIPHTDGSQTEHGFVSLLPLSEGRIGAVWLDGRNLKDLKHSEGHGSSPANMTLRYATIGKKGELTDEAVLDDRVCECCQTAATLTSAGAVVVYRDRSETEVRDIYIVRRQNGIWTQPQPVHVDGWTISGCPVNGPSIAAAGHRVAVAWYSEADDNPRVNIALSMDGGAAFGKPIQIDDGHAVGRVNVAMLDDGSVVVCWLSGTVESGAIKVRSVTSDGRLGPVTIVATSDISRSSGFPRLARAGDEILFAWTEFGKPSYVRTATINLRL